jgi:hypothetical protein
MPRRQRNAAVFALCLLAAPFIAARAIQDVAPDTGARIAVSAVVFVPIANPAAVGERAPALVSSAPAGVTRRTAPADLRANATASAARSVPWANGANNSTMMIVGGAALVVGAVAGGKGGTMLMVGGGAIGLLGLWNALQ